MGEKRSKYSPSIKERTSMFSETSRFPQENFITELLSHCKEYKVDLSPKFVVENDTVDLRLAYRFSQLHGITLVTDPKKILPLLYLSLQLCKITDEGVKKIMQELQYADPPNEPRLLTLNLANNHISDRGAAEIARMLRTNRSLQSLMLTGNRICDDGAILIIRALNMSQLTHPEIVDLRRRRYDALLLQETMLNEINPNEDNDTQKAEEIQNLEVLQIKNESKGSRRKSKKSKKLSSSETLTKITESGNFQRISRNSIADAIPDVEIYHPFGKESLAIGGVVRTSGNFVLRHLNLSFNRLTGETLQELLKCLRYQMYMMLNDTSRGLLYIKVEGNKFKQQDDKSLLELEELLQSRRLGEYLTRSEEPEDVIQLENKNLSE
ncbi:hypothetical protein KPH14_007128 [Odynerus spinipes]|uniref:Leucine-rich repeat-containing protein 71 n=1 Tax=Odynerus spinipes TaxID=1348599 RepID=A0AAD9RSI2_9HYME|nr:hypothetical protein KPH14_007128 [Odynerus spinipes]